jgi:hypothetical protein
MSDDVESDIWVRNPLNGLVTDPAVGEVASRITRVVHRGRRADIPRVRPSGSRRSSGQKPSPCAELSPMRTCSMNSPASAAMSRIRVST